MHVTLRAREGLPSFRSDKLVFEGVCAAIEGGQTSAFRIVQFSVQSNHLHLIVEAHDAVALSRGMQGLSVRMACAVNRALGGKGNVFADRYHAHELTTPRETRAALLYVLQNWAKHGPGGSYDPRSSAVWFDGWTVPPQSEGTRPIVAAPRTWLVTVGWRRHGRLKPGERPGGQARSRTVA